MKKNVRWNVAQAAEIRWWKLYLKNKPPEEYLKWKLAYWQELINHLQLTFQEEEYILDAGCGPAGIFMAIPEGKIEATDPLLEKYESELDTFQKSDYPHIKFHSKALEEFGSAKKYDKLFCINAINHVADLKLCFQKLADLTAQGGQLILSIDAHNWKFFKYFFRMLPGDILHPHQFGLMEYKEMVADAGFSITQDSQYRKSFLFNYYIIVAVKN